MIYKETSQPNQKEQFTAVMRKQLTYWDCISLKCKHITNNINEQYQRTNLDFRQSFIKINTCVYSTIDNSTENK